MKVKPIHTAADHEAALARLANIDLLLPDAFMVIIAFIANKVCFSVTF